MKESHEQVCPANRFSDSPELIVSLFVDYIVQTRKRRTRSSEAGTLMVVEAGRGVLVGGGGCW